MEFSSEMNIYRESELSGDFEGEIRERRNQQENNQAGLGGSATNLPCRQLYLLSQNRYFTHLMSYGSDWNVENFGDISKKDNIFTDFLENFPIFPTSPGRAQTWYFDRFKNISKILVFLSIFFWEISLYILPV